MLWNEWFTVNSVISVNIIQEDNTQPSDKDKIAEIESEKASINHVEEINLEPPTRWRETHKSRESSKLNRSNNKAKKECIRACQFE